MPSPITSHACFQALCFLIHCLLHRTHFSCVMAGEVDQILLATGDAASSNSKVMSGAESDIAPASYSSNAATWMIAKKVVPMLYDHWKKSTVIEADLAAYHAVDWLPGGVISSTSDLEFATIYKIIIACFKSHLITGLDLSPSKFLVSILNFLRCELVHLNPNTIAALSYFSMLCECCLWIAPDTSLFWYFYSPSRYDKQVFFGIGLSLCRHHQNEYPSAKFKGC
jgi:hypothetical protein